MQVPLNAVYRFDEPGHYTVHVVTGRVERGTISNLVPLGALNSNVFEFTMEAMDTKVEADRAAWLESEFRNASNLSQATGTRKS